MALMSRGLTPAPAGNCSGASTSWLARLPEELLDLILRDASGTAYIDRCVDSAKRAACRFDLRWRRVLAPSFYHYAVYDGGAGRLMIPKGCEQHVRWLLVDIPDICRSYRNAVQPLYELPVELRSRVLWLGLFIGKRSTLPLSGCDPLVGAFPGLRQIWLDTGILTDELHDVYPEIAGTNVSAPITVLVLRANVFRNRATFFSLIRAAAASLTHLDIGHAGISTVCELLWSPDEEGSGDRPMFPRLTGLFINIFDVRGGPPVMPPQPSPFPKLKALMCHWPEPIPDGSRGEELRDRVRRFVAMLLAHVPAQLRRLDFVDLGGDVAGMLRGKELQLETLELFHRCRFDNGTSGQRGFEMAAAIPGLKVLTYSTNRPFDQPQFDWRCPSHPNLRVLDFRRWFLSLCDLQLLLSKLPRLEKARVTLTRPQIHPAREDIGYHMSMQWLWINSASREEDKWDKDSRESLATMLARMPRLGKVRLFESAKWFIDDATKSNREDLKHLACNVRIEYYEVDHNDYDYDDYDDYDDESRDDSGDEDSSEDDNDDGDDVGSDDESSDDSDDDSSAY